MNENLLRKIDREIENCREDLAKDTIRLIAVKSVMGEPLPGAPFGAGPRQMLDTVLEWGRKEGFYTEDHGVGVIHIAERAGQPDLGIWLHGDVVPEGEGWLYDPYQAVEYKGCIIGRGATDNKGQLCSIFHLLKIFRKLGVSLNYLPALYVGSNEENGKFDLRGIPGNEDARGFINCCTPPRLSLVPDSSFPVACGTKGGLGIRLRTKKPLKGVVLSAGLNNTPGRGAARIGDELIETFSIPRHLTKLISGGNMITSLMEKLLARPDTDPADRPVLEFFRLLSLDLYGEKLGLKVATETMTPLILRAYRIETIEGCPEITLNIRYPIETNAETIRGKVSAAAEKAGLYVSYFDSRNLPVLIDKENPVLRRLLTIANEITGENKEPYIVGGGTYADILPNAFAFGMDGRKVPEGFPEGRGEAHGMDELVSLNRLQRAMRIYARALLALNEMDW